MYTLKCNCLLVSKKHRAVELEFPKDVLTGICVQVLLGIEKHVQVVTRTVDTSEIAPFYDTKPVSIICFNNNNIFSII